MMIKRVTQKVCLWYGRKGCRDAVLSTMCQKSEPHLHSNGNDIHVVSVATILEVGVQPIGGLVQTANVACPPVIVNTVHHTAGEGSQAILFQDTSLLLANGHVHYHQEGKLAAQMPLSLMETCKASVTVLRVTKGIYS